jgi:RNA recognition motif. (a.k.a. RRM, RBD, or RNP domain)
MKLWIANLAPGTTDDEIRAFVKKYGPELECTRIERVEGDGSRPAAVLEFTGSSEALGKLNLRLSGLYWKGRALMSSMAITS